MANNNTVSLSQPVVPIFKGERYGRWSLRIKTLFKSHELWKLVEKGITESKDEALQ